MERMISSRFFISKNLFKDKGPFGTHDMIKIKDRKRYRQDKHLSYHIFGAHIITNMISYISELNDIITLIINYN